MGDDATFDFRASLVGLDQGLELIHRSLDQLRSTSGRGPDDRPLLLFEIALAEIGGNVLTHGSPTDASRPVEYRLRLLDGSVEAVFVDSGPPAFEHLEKEMPGPDREDGRGLALARSVLDGLGYERDGGLNRWRLVKRL